MGAWRGQCLRCCMCRRARKRGSSGAMHTLLSHSLLSHFSWCLGTHATAQTFSWPLLRTHHDSHPFNDFRSNYNSGYGSHSDQCLHCCVCRVHGREDRQEQCTLSCRILSCRILLVPRDTRNCANIGLSYAPITTRIPSMTFLHKL